MKSNIKKIFNRIINLNYIYQLSLDDMSYKKIDLIDVKIVGNRLFFQLSNGKYYSFGKKDWEIKLENRIYFPNSSRLHYYIKTTSNLNPDDVDKEFKEICKEEKQFLSENKNANYIGENIYSLQPIIGCRYILFYRIDDELHKLYTDNCNPNKVKDVIVMLTGNKNIHIDYFNWIRQHEINENISLYNKLKPKLK